MKNKLLVSVLIMFVQLTSFSMEKNSTQEDIKQENRMNLSLSDPICYIEHSATRKAISRLTGYYTAPNEPMVFLSGTFHNPDLDIRQAKEKISEFVNTTYRERSEDEKQTIIEETMKNIATNTISFLLPLSVLLNKNKLIHKENTVVVYEPNAPFNLFQTELQTYINNFQQTPNIRRSRENILIENEIIAINNGVITHGPCGYFAKEPIMGTGVIFGKTPCTDKRKERSTSNYHKHL